MSTPSHLASPEWNDLERAIRTSQALRNGLCAQLQDDLLLLLVDDSIEVTAELAEESFELLLGHVVLSQDTKLNALLQRTHDDADSVWLCEDASCDLVGTLRLGRVRRRISAQEKLGVAAYCSLQQCSSIRWVLRDWLAEAVWITSPVIDCDEHVVGCDGGCDCVATGLDSFDCRRRCAVLQDDSQLWKSTMQIKQGRQEGLFGVEDGDIVASRRRKLAVQVEDQVLSLHLFEDRVELLVRHDSMIGVRGHAVRIGLNAGHPLLLGFLDGIRADVGMKIERHEKLDVWLQFLKALLVLESMMDRRDWRDQIGLLCAYLVLK